MHVHANNQCMLYFNTFLCHLCCLFSVVFFSFHTHITLTLHCSNLRIILGLYTFEIRYKESFFQYFEMIKYGWVIRSNKAWRDLWYRLSSQPNLITSYYSRNDFLELIFIKCSPRDPSKIKLFWRYFHFVFLCKPRLAPQPRIEYELFWTIRYKIDSLWYHREI